MLYSSCKNSVVEVLEKVYSIIINKKIEVDSGAELTEEYLLVRPLVLYYIIPIFLLCITGRAPSSQESEQTKICQASSAQQGQEKNDEGSTILRNIFTNYLISLKENVKQIFVPNFLCSVYREMHTLTSILKSHYHLSNLIILVRTNHTHIYRYKYI